MKYIKKFENWNINEWDISKRPSVSEFNNSELLGDGDRLNPKKS